MAADLQPVVKYIEWVDDMPRPAYAPLYSNQQITQVARSAFSFPYKPKTRWNVDTAEYEILDEEKEFIGKSCLEVMYIRRAQTAAEGCLDSQNFLHDRVIGKPKQHTEITSVNVTFGEALDHIANSIEKKRGAQIGQIVDVETITVQEHVLGHLW